MALAKAEITGIIQTIFQSETVSERFRKRIIWLEEKPARHTPNIYEIEFNQGSGDILDHYKSGDRVMVRIDIQGRQRITNGRHRVYNTLVGFDIERVVTSPEQISEQPIRG